VGEGVVPGVGVGVPVGVGLDDPDGVGAPSGRSMTNSATSAATPATTRTHLVPLTVYLLVRVRAGRPAAGAQ